MLGSLPIMNAWMSGTRLTRSAANEANCFRAVEVSGVVLLPKGITVTVTWR